MSDSVKNEEKNDDDKRKSTILNQPELPELKDVGREIVDDELVFRSRKFIGKETEPSKKKRRNKTIVQILRIGLISLVAFLALICAAFLIWYIRVASALPSVGDLREKASQFETARILDRDGNLLNEIIDPNAGRRDYVTLEQISPYLIATTIATEDKMFFDHPGFDVFAILRATIQNARSQSTVSGASTITQQLARNLLLSPEERSQRTIGRKMKEIFLAAEITRRYSKSEILELYLNENYYSNFAYGIEAASQTYFGIPAQYLDLGQAAFLSGLPQAPSYYDVFSNYEGAIKRQNEVLLISYALSKEKKCIQANEENSTRICIDELMVADAAKEIKEYKFTKTGFEIRYPHWVFYVRSILEEAYGAQNIYRSGFTVYTTLDKKMQDEAEKLLADQIGRMREANQAHNGALISIDPKNGEILAMVGSPDFYDDDHGGQINMAVSPRQPGSAIKPLIYAAAFEKGWTPATLIWDVAQPFSPTGKADDPYSEPYIPVNYDGISHGAVLARDALANSYNIAAVKALEYVGIYDDPATENEDGFISLAKRFHINSLDKPGYGLSLALGGGEATLLEMTKAFGVFANNGNYVRSSAILKIYNDQNELIYSQEHPNQEHVLNEEYTYLINSILSDNQARTPMFGSASVLNTAYPSAVKTGTTNDFRDNWTIGYTPDLATGVWVGNADYSPMIDTTGLSGAAPIWADFMNYAVPLASNGNPSDFVRPSGIVDLYICAVTGAEPSDKCPYVKTEKFAYYRPPAPSDQDIWKEVAVNTWSGLIANQYCPENNRTMLTLNVSDVYARNWLMTTPEGRSWIEKNGFGPYSEVVFTPSAECEQRTTNPKIAFSNLSQNQEIDADQIKIYALVNNPDGGMNYGVEFGEGENPSSWYVIENNLERQTWFPEQIAEWQLGDLANGVYSLRIIATTNDGQYAEQRLVLRINRRPHVSAPEPEIQAFPVYEEELKPAEEIPDFFKPIN